MRGIIGGNEQGLPDMEPSETGELEHGEPVEEDQSFSETEQSEESHAELRFEGEPSRGESEESIARGESLEDGNMEEPSEQENEATETAAQPSPAEEVQKALNMLEGRGPSRIESGPSRVMGGKSAALRERAKFKPYDRTQRRQPTPQLSIPPQETLEQDINALLQTAAQEQTPRPVTQINFLDVQHRPVSETNDEQSARPIASQVGMIQDGQQAPEETLGSVEFDPQPELPSATDQSSRRHGITNTQSETEALRSESVPPDASPHGHTVAEATQQDAVTERPSLSPPRESSTQTDVRTHIARSEWLPEEQDSSPGRREGANDGTKHSAVTIMFRARDEQGEWNRLVHQMEVDPSDPSPVERMAAKQARAQQATYYDQNLRQVPPGQCFDAAIEDGTNTIFVTFGDDLTVSEEMVDTITRALQADRDDDDRPAKRMQQTRAM